MMRRTTSTLRSAGGTFVVAMIFSVSASVCLAQTSTPSTGLVEYENIRPLVEKVIRTGTASGMLTGTVAVDFNKNIGLSAVNAAPVTAYLSLLDRLNPSCGRVSFDISRPGQTALAPDGQRYPQRIVWAMNICTSGIPSPAINSDQTKGQQ